MPPRGQFADLRGAMQFEGQRTPETRFDPEVNSSQFLVNAPYYQYDFSIEPSGLADPNSSDFPVLVRHNNLDGINFDSAGKFIIDFRIYAQQGSQLQIDLTTIFGITGIVKT